MKKAKLALMIAGIAVVPLTSGCMTMLAKMAVGMATNKTSDLSVCALQTKYISNLYPKEAKTFELDFYPPTYNEGDSIVTMSCQARVGTGLFEIEGTVQINGEPMDPMVGGMFAKVIKKGDTSPKTISIVTKTGQKAQFSVQPSKPINLVKINGEKSGAKVDVTKDMTLTFGDVPAEETYVRVGVLTESAGMRNFSNIGTYKLEKEVKVPAAAFKHPQLYISTGGNLKVGKRLANKSMGTSTKLITGENYIVVERYDVKPLKVDGVPAAQHVALGWNWSPVEIKGDVQVVAGIVSSETVKTETGGVDYTITKPNATLGKPFAKAKKFALVAMSVSGPMKVVTVTEGHQSALTTKQFDNIGQEKAGPADRQNVWQFPKVPIAYWDSELENLHANLSEMLEKDFGITLIPLEQVVSAKAYQELEKAPDEYTEDKISRAYKNTRLLSGVRVGSGTFGADQSQVQLMRELGVDGLVVANINIDLPIDTKGLNQLMSSIHFRIVGSPTAYTPEETIYSEGQVVTNKPIPFKDDEFTDADTMNRVVRRTDLVKGLSAALKDQETKAKELGYDAIWSRRPIESAEGKLLF